MTIKLIVVSGIVFTALHVKGQDTLYIPRHPSQPTCAYLEINPEDPLWKKVKVEDCRGMMFMAQTGIPFYAQQQIDSVIVLYKNLEKAPDFRLMKQGRPLQVVIDLSVIHCFETTLNQTEQRLSCREKPELQGFEEPFLKEIASACPEQYLHQVIRAKALLTSCGVEFKPRSNACRLPGFFVIDVEETGNRSNTQVLIIAKSVEMKFDIPLAAQCSLYLISSRGKRIGRYEVKTGAAFFELPAGNLFYYKVADNSLQVFDEGKIEINN